MAGVAALQDVVQESRPESLRVLTCVSDPRLRARLQDALRDRADLQMVGTLGELLASLRSSTRITDVVILSPRDSSGREAPGAVREIAARFPQIAVIAYCRAAVENSADIRGLAVAGVHEFLFTGDDSPNSIRGLLDSARRECAAERVLTVLARVLPAQVHPLAEACLGQPASVISVENLATQMGTHRKTLYNRCVDAGAPRPAELIKWCRLSLAAYMLAQTGRTVESVTRELEFPSPSALRNMFKRYTGLRPGQVRASGGAECVARSLATKIKKTSLLHVV